MSSPNDPREPATPDESGPEEGRTPEPPRYPAGTSPDAPAPGGAGEPPQPPAYGAPPAYRETPHGQQGQSGYGQQPYGQQGQPAYGQGPSGYPGYGSASTERNSLGVWSLVLGIVSVALCCLVIGVVPGAFGIWLGIRGRQAVARGQATNGGVALTGIILSVIGILVGLYFLLSFALLINQQGGWDGFVQYVEEQAQVQDQLSTP